MIILMIKKYKAECSCDVETTPDSIINMNIDLNKLKNNIKDIKNIANIKFLKCYKTLFNKKSIKSNIGFYIYSSIELSHIIFTILFIIKYRILLINIKNKIFVKKNVKKTKINDINNINNINNNKKPKLELNQTKKKKNKHILNINNYNLNQINYKTNYENDNNPPKRINKIKNPIEPSYKNELINAKNKKEKIKGKKRKRKLNNNNNKNRTKIEKENNNNIVQYHD